MPKRWITSRVIRKRSNLKGVLSTWFDFGLEMYSDFTCLFLGVLIGMQTANDGIKKMKGYEDPHFE